MPNKLTAALHTAFVAISDKDTALAFYQDKLGLTLIADQSPFALVFDLTGTPLRATFVPDPAAFKPQQFTVLGWRVEDIDVKAAELAAAGVEFNHYPFVQNGHPHGVWDAPGGVRIAWFNDPFGNVLSLQQDA
jgi:catechol 2,3-dioxygenase-like lactoylglutathione lyase family enzyme